MCNAGWYKERYDELCRYCKVEIATREHITNECKEFNDIRNKTIDEFKQLQVMKENESLKECFIRNYFNQNEDKVIRKKVWSLMSDMIIMFTIMKKKNEESEDV